MTQSAANTLLLHKVKPLSPALLGTIAFGVCLLYIGGQYLSLPVIVFPILAIVLSIGLFFARSAGASLKLFIGTAFGLSFRIATSQGTDIVDILAGLAIGGVLLAWWVRLFVIERESLTFTQPQLLISLFIAWGLLIGIGGIWWWNNSFNDWARELLILCPVMVIPMLYTRLYEAESASEARFHRFIFVAALVVMVASVGKYAIVLTQSSYAYQIGRISTEQSPSMVLLLACIAFTLHRVDFLSTFWRLMLASFCVALLILSGYRTLWVAVALTTIVMFFMTDSHLRAKAVKFLIMVAGLLITIGTYLFFSVRIFQIFAMMTYNRILSTAEVSTDPSLVNRYIETAIVKQHVLQSPIVGYGFGAKFQTFDWLLGYSYLTGFSHNGYFFVAFKAGIIGFALFFTAYAWFLVKAFQLARDVKESARTRAIASVAFCYFCCQLIANLTLNFFGDRNAMIWFGLFWAFIISREMAKKRRVTRVLVPAGASE